jgi:hypothetical protein
MKLNLYLLIAAILALIFGLGFLLVPVLTLSLYGVDLSQSPHAQFLTRYGGSAFLGWAAAWFMARNDKTFDGLKKAGLLGGLVLGVTGLIVAIWNATAGITNSLIWINPVIYLFLSIGFAYFYFKK